MELEEIRKLIKEMTLEEKAGLCSGLDFWRTKGIERLNVPSIMVSDGPHGLRKQAAASDQVDFASIPATCFPSGAGLACSWDRSLLEKVGGALGEECQAEDIAILLGPAANIKRSPLCGRNFEYLSEDPYLSSEMAGAHVKGVQSQGVGTALKHFAANNQETRRLSVDANIDERTLRELYLASFEGVVKQERPWTVMCAYNKLNGTYCSENKYLLNDVLREQWGFEGFVMSDWGAVNERVDALAAGLELEMPSSKGAGDQKIVDAVKSCKIPESTLDRAVERILEIVFRAHENKKANASFDKNKHHELARKAAGECMVLLKNEDSILPLKRPGKIAVIGAFAKTARYQGGGSSHVNPSKLDVILDEIKKSAGDKSEILYGEGYKLTSDETDQGLIDEAKEIARQSDVAVIFAGLTERYESEGFDRGHMNISGSHSALIEAVADVQDKVVVVLSNGAPIEMPWACRVDGILEAYLGGQAMGGAAVDILFGDVNPSGKLAESFPLKLSHNPSYINFPGEGDKVEYREGLFVGYRYYDKTNTDVLFPFGHGLSYTTFDYTGISLDKKEIYDNDTVKIYVRIKNTGKVAGKEIVQLYVRDIKSSVIRPEKELKGFEKVELNPGEEKTVTFDLSKRAFAYYNTEIGDWHVESGEFEILVGRSSKQIELTETVKVNSTAVIKKKYNRRSLLIELAENPDTVETFENIKKMFVDMVSHSSFSKEVEENLEMYKTMMLNFTLSAIVDFSQGKFTEEMLDGLLQKLNS